jgi:redox-sensitive bicupin YhaK (pirin superfamily)
MGRAVHSWLHSIHHFSFANYYNPDNIQFGVLRVLNDDLVESGEGFDIHPHENMEIISYVVDGELTHGDSMGNKSALKRGEAQYMSAGSGVCHSEHNLGKDMLRFLQIWIFPDAEDYEPNYGDYRFKWEDRENKWLPIAASVKNKKNNAPIKIHADVNVYAAFIKKNGNVSEEKLSFEISKGRQAYLVLIEGKACVNKTAMNERDAMEIVEENIEIAADDFAHVIIFEMKKPRQFEYDKQNK